MKLDDKKKKVQLKYREKIKRQREDDKNYTKQALIIATILVLIFLSIIYFHDIFFKPEPDDGFRIEKWPKPE
ncbi:hypothetical protein [Bacillus bingmayongensis]|uniref:hypothetical protein n=1 Tax=Bacillus TaxID=1386 RepID=UPI0002E68FD1|nr:hypothetical protein [Bacillus bingmayongensis]